MTIDAVLLLVLVLWAAFGMWGWAIVVRLERAITILDILVMPLMLLIGPFGLVIVAAYSGVFDRPLWRW